MMTRLKDLAGALKKKVALKWFIWRKYRNVFGDIKKGDVTIDCGANVGDVTSELAARGAMVYAFEPHPQACQVLRKRFEGNWKVRVINQAVWRERGTMKLYMHKDSTAGPVELSVAALLLSDKDNVDANEFVEVETVDFAAFIKSLKKQVKLIKMDIEGAEYDVLLHLIRTGAIQHIEGVLVETHDKKNPGLAGKRRELEWEISKGGFGKIDLNWT
jgi:FkbM family methyltransferase